MLGGVLSNKMTALANQRRIIGVCESCESIYAARVLSDGRVQPIGVTACSCGCDEFEILE